MVVFPLVTKHCVMTKAIFSYLLLHVLSIVYGRLSVSAQIRTPQYTSHHPSEDKESWQRLNLLLSSTFIVVVKEGQVEHDTCLSMASRSLGLSRISVLAEGIDGPELPRLSRWIDLQQPGTGVRMLATITDRKHIELLLLLASYYAFQPNSYYRYKDSVDYFVNTALQESRLLKEDRLGRQGLCLLGKIYVQANDPKGDSIFTLVINQSRRAGDKLTEARATAYRGIYAAPNQFTFQQKLTDLQTAAGLYRQLGNSEGEINVLTDLGYMLVVTGQLQPANEIFSKALALAEAIRFPYTQYITDALAMVTSFQGKFGEPFRYTLQTIKTAENVRDSIGTAYFFSRLAILYASEGRAKESMEMAQKSVNRFILTRDPSVYAILNMVVDDMCNEGRATEALKLVFDISKAVGSPKTLSEMFTYNDALAGCYLSLDRLNQAEAHVRTMDSLETKAEAIRGPLSRTIVTDMYGHLFFKRRQYKKAREYFEKHFIVPSYGQHTLQNNLGTYRSLIATDSALGDHLSAIRHYARYTALLDSTFQVTKIRQAEELRVLYETQEKESQIAALNQQAKQTRLVKNLTLAGIGLVAVIAALLYRQSRLRKKNNQLISGQNEQLQNLLADKEWLLKEIHHRVKNNLQIIMSLLDSQSVYIDDNAALTAINDSQRRVQAISLIHQRLYQSENSSSINMPLYIDELVDYLKESFGTGNRIVIEQEIEPLKLDVATAIPLGLIINEGIVNAMKYAFPNDRRGNVRICLCEDDSRCLRLKIGDNGVGLPSGFDVSKQNSLGFSLMQGLTRQLDGNFDFKSENGLHLSIQFMN